VQIGKTPTLKRPRDLTASQIDPFKSARARAVLPKLRKLCLQFPETGESIQFGHPVWQAGKKTFAIARYEEDRLTLCFWVGIDRQGLLTSDPRYATPPYFGHNGWISLDVAKSVDWQEVHELAAHSYRHFALKRMLQKLGA
jgi:predicted DNA-binding protein (MmcQ/YjbR family)